MAKTCRTEGPCSISECDCGFYDERKAKAASRDPDVTEEARLDALPVSAQTSVAADESDILISSAVRCADYVSQSIIDGKRVSRGDTEELRNHVRKLAAALTATSASPTLDERMKAAGMFTVDEMMGVTPLTRWKVQAGMTDLDAFGEWLDRKASEYLRMKAAYDLGDKDEKDDLYEWVLAHAGVFSSIRENFRAASAATAPSTNTEVRLERLERAQRNAGQLLSLMRDRPTDRHTLTYTNYRGETSDRELHLVRIWYGGTEWHPEPQLLLSAFDFGKDAYRDFAVSDFALADGPPQPATNVLWTSPGQLREIERGGNGTVTKHGDEFMCVPLYVGTPTAETDTLADGQIAGARFLFGLEAQGHIPTIEAMLAEQADWQEIGRRILWDGDTAKAHYQRYLARNATKGRSVD
ncbi:hypothetical protein [Rhizobium laguerreae]|uniref:hypothetical protein n=1 Tax=Rhizobium laguerreae TaxID=1076926 RepID=UPI001C917535|nr:hypothetical protein [Rhizobium laguerreae]